MPLLEVLYLSQTLNAVLLLGILPLMLRLGRDPAVMGDQAPDASGRSPGSSRSGSSRWPSSRSWCSSSSDDLRAARRSGTRG